MAEAYPSLAQPDSDLFFTLSPARLTEALAHGMQLDSLSREQQLYARAALLQTASVAVGAMEEKARASGLAARKLSPAHSMARDIHGHEAALYALIDKGDADAVGRIVRNQKITTTAHPNFSRSRELVKKAGELTQSLEKLDAAAIRHIEETGTLPPGSHIGETLAEMKPLLRPREKRTRRDELQETVLDVIPTVMRAASEQLALIKRRKAIVCEPRRDAGGERQPERFSSVGQLEAVAKLLPEYNSWFLDGDGKRSCHVYDAELAIPAIKRATYEEYVELLKKLPDKLGDFDTERWKRRLTHAIGVMKEVEDLAGTPAQQPGRPASLGRLDALNALHESYEAYRADSADPDNRRAFAEARANAQKASRRYMDKLHEPTREGKTTIDVLKENLATELEAELKTALESAYAGKARVPDTHREVAEDLYIKLKAYGNFAVSLQRRENANEYRDVFEYLMQNSPTLQHKLAEKLDVSADDLLGLLDKPEIHARMIEEIAGSALSEADPLGARETIFRHYKRLASKLEKTLKDGGNGDSLVIKPLEIRELLALDDLGCFNMARLYPEAFRGGFVIAEFAQPDSDTLGDGDASAIREGVVGKARSDMLMHLALSHAMGAPHIATIPLHEDPATMRYAPDAQETLRSQPIRDVLLKGMGVSTAAEADAKTVLHIDRKGDAAPLSAYQDLKAYGVGDAEMRRKGLDVASLKTTFILNAPPDMEAASDIGKRGTIMGSEEAEQSVREKAIAAAKHPVEIDGRRYVIRRPKYVGEGGAIARASRPPIDTQQVTRQGEHLSVLTPFALAQECLNKTLGRLFLTQQGAFGEKPTRELAALARGRIGHTGNTLGLPGHGVTDTERELMDLTISTRIAGTRDDKRYNDFLTRYGEPALNMSARPNAKGGKAETFNSGRAIGIAAKEAGIWANVIGISAMFDFGAKGKGKGEITAESAREIRRWKDSDPYIQHLMTAAALVVNLVNLKEKWARADIAYHQDESGGVTLTKGQSAVKLETLLDAYNNRRSELVTTEGVRFEAGDLVMAHMTDQFHKLEKGLHAVYPGKKENIEFFDEAQRPGVLAYKNLYDDILKTLRETKGAKSADRTLLEGAYYVLFESGSSIFPSAGLVERGMYQAAAASR